GYASRWRRRTRRNKARSTAPATRCSGRWCARCAPSPTGIWPRPRDSSCVLPHQVDEDILERALRGVDVLQPDVLAEQSFDQPGHAAVLALRLVGVDQRVAVVGQGQVVRCKFRRNGGELLLQLEFHLLL